MTVLSGNNIYNPGMQGKTVHFVYNGKVRTVLVQKYTPRLTDSFITGPELTDGGQIKSFTLNKIDGNITVED